MAERLTRGRLLVGGLPASKTYAPVRNETGNTLAVGTLVYVSGWSETHKRFKISKADADVAGARATFVLRAAIGNNANGTAYRQARLTAVNTNGAAVGDPVYLSATVGTWALAAPSATNSIAQIVGRVAVVHASTGQIEIDLDVHPNLLRIGSNELQAGAAPAGALSLPVRNETGGNLAAGDLVAISGWSETHARHLVVKADADVSGRRAQLVMQGALNNNTNGSAYASYRHTGVATDGASVGDAVYLSTVAGGWTVTAPTGADDVVQVVGYVAVVDAAAGEVEFNLSVANLLKVGSNELQPLSVLTAALAASAVTPAKTSLPVRNETGGELAAGQLVYVAGWSEAQTRFLLAKADANAAGKPAQFVLQAAIGNNANGTANPTHRLTGVNTDGASVGDPVYLSETAGGWTLTGPTAATSIQQVVGRVAVVDAATGEIEFDLSTAITGKIGANELQPLSVETAALAAGAVTIPKLEAQVLRSVDVTIAVADVKILNATPYELVPAPAAGSALVFEGAVAYKVGGAVAWDSVGAGDDLSVLYDGSDEVGRCETVGFMDQNTAQARFIKSYRPASGMSDINLTTYEALALKLTALTGEIWAAAAADQPLVLRVYYRVVPTTL